MCCISWHCTSTAGSVQAQLYIWSFLSTNSFSACVSRCHVHVHSCQRHMLSCDYSVTLMSHQKRSAAFCCHHQISWEVRASCSMPLPTASKQPTVIKTTGVSADIGKPFAACIQLKPVLHAGHASMLLSLSACGKSGIRHCQACCMWVLIVHVYLCTFQMVVCVPYCDPAGT